jgi:hypothetical protein
MEWLIIGVLTVVVLILISIYRRSLRESRGLANLVHLILLDPKIYSAQSKGLADLVHGIEAKNAIELSGKVYLATTELAERLSGNSLGTAGLLWKLKTGPT